MTIFLAHPFSKQNVPIMLVEINVIVLFHELKTFASLNKGLCLKHSGGSINYSKLTEPLLHNVQLFLFPAKHSKIFIPL